MHARRQAAAFVRNEIASESYDETLINIHQQLLFKNFSQKSHLVMLNVTVDTLVSLKQNRGDAAPMAIIRLFNFYQFVEDVMMMEPSLAFS